MKTPKHIKLSALALIASAAPIFAADYTVSLPDYIGNPGDVVTVPLNLSNATSLAMVRVQINFDPQVATLESASAGELGSAFNFAYQPQGGMVNLDLIRANVLDSGSGSLAFLTFRLNPGASVNLFTNLAIAQFEIGDDSGVTDLAQTNTLTVDNGSITISLDDKIDNAGNKIPDSWERSHNLNPLLNRAEDDSDQDGFNNFMEYAFGGNPWGRDTSLGPFASHDASQYLMLTLRRRTDDPSLVYVLEESDNLVDWDQSDLSSRMVGEPIDLGDNIEGLTVRSSASLDQGTANSIFLRLSIDRPE